MKKFGFTLMEVVVALGIVSIVAAITGPYINNITPDRDKLVVLKTYKVITEANQDIMNDPLIWENTPSVNRQNWVHLANNTTYTQALADRMQIIQVVEAERSNAPLPNWNLSSINTFETIDGVHWRVDIQPEFALVSINVNSEITLNDCTYNNGNCRKPKIFNFRVDSETLQVKGGDALTAAYLANPSKTNDKKYDYSVARSDNRDYWNPGVGAWRR